MKKIILVFTLLFSWQSFSNVNLENIKAYSIDKKIEESLQFKSAANHTVVIFLSKDCPCSKANLDYINQLSREFTKFHFIGVHSKKETKPEEVLDYLSDKKMNFSVYSDADLKIADIFGALKTPHAFIVDPAGAIVYNGGITNTTSPSNAKEFFLKDTLTEIENHKTPSKPQTRTLGCFIIR